MSELDDLYKQMLACGFLILRRAADVGDVAWLRSEITLLHNVPSLIGESNRLRHKHFWEHERIAYLDWSRSHGHAAQRSAMDTYYGPLWEQMASLLMDR